LEIITPSRFMYEEDDPLNIFLQEDEPGEAEAAKELTRNNCFKKQDDDAVTLARARANPM